MAENVTKRMGRPNSGDYSDPETGEINDAGLTIIRRAAGLGLTLVEMASLIGMSDRTLYDRRKQFPEVQEIINLGEAEAGVRVAHALIKKAEQGDMAAIRWYEMTRKNRAEKTETKAETTSYVIEVPALMPEDEWETAHSPQALPTDDSTDSPI